MDCEKRVENVVEDGECEMWKWIEFGGKWVVVVGGVVLLDESWSGWVLLLKVEVVGVAHG